MAVRKEYVKKITTKSVGIIPDVCEPLVEGKGVKAVTVMRVYGVVRKTKTGTTPLGPYTEFEGEFEAVNAIDGHKVRSRKLILPSVAEPVVAGAFEAEQKSNKDATLTFGLDITALENTSQKGGYKFKYGVNALKGSDKQDALDMLGSELGGVPLLEAPEETKSKSKSKK